MSTCPTCNGSGAVPQHIAEALVRSESANTDGGDCWCDGPQHRYSRGWCPLSGPVVRKRL